MLPPSNSSFVQAVRDIKRSIALFSEVWTFIFLTFGVIGHTLNVYIFTRPKFRHNPCVRYFLAATVCGYEVVLFAMPLRMLQNGFSIDLFSYSVSSCKILTYILACFRILSSWFIALASIDRFLCSSSSTRFRGWSNLRFVNYAILFTILFIFLSHIHLLVYQKRILPSRTCTIISSTYQAFYALWNLIFWSWIPTICMLIFGWLIIRNIDQTKRRAISQNYHQRKQRKTDRQLIRMLLIQAFVLGSTTTALSIGSLYVSITNSFMIKNDLDKAKDTYLNNILYYLASFGTCMSFYIFTLSSPLFRNELMNLFVCWRQPSRVAPDIRLQPCNKLN